MANLAPFYSSSMLQAFPPVCMEPEGRKMEAHGVCRGNHIASRHGPGTGRKSVPVPARRPCASMEGMHDLSYFRSKMEAHGVCRGNHIASRHGPGTGRKS